MKDQIVMKKTTSIQLNHQHSNCNNLNNTVKNIRLHQKQFIVITLFILFDLGMDFTFYFFIKYFVKRFYVIELLM